METAAETEVVPQVLTALRVATRASHKSAERLTPFFRASFDRAAYIRWLDLMHGFYRRVDEAVANSAFPLETGWEYLPRCPMLRHDRMALTSQSPTEPWNSQEALTSLSELRLQGEIAGMLYVVEGSALGGKVLLGVLARAAAVTADSGASFFAPHGEDPYPQWNKYIQLLARFSTDADWQRDAVRGATITFSALENWIQQAWRD